MKPRARQPARRAPDPALVELVRAMARDAARRDHEIEEAGQRQATLGTPPAALGQPATTG